MSWLIGKMMVVVEIKARGQRFTINGGRIVDGDRGHAPVIRELAGLIGGHPGDGDPDYCIAQEFVAQYGGRIVAHEYTDYNPDVIY